MAMSPDDGGDDRGLMAEINVTPFVDVMLVLLVIFMVTTPMMTLGMQVELPRVDAPPLPASDEQLVLSIDAEGRAFLNDREIPAGELGEKLAAIARANPDQDLFLKADGRVPYEHVARVLATATAAGFPRIGMVTRPEGAAE